MADRGNKPLKRAAMLLLLLIVAAGCDEDKPPREITAALGGAEFRLELAVSDAQIRKGMMGRTALDRDAGMLFVFRDERSRQFWMKDCLIPLDVLFLDREGRIVSIHTMPVPDEHERDNPPSYPSRWPAQYAIEINAGRAGELRLEPGRKIELPLTKLQRWAR